MKNSKMSWITKGILAGLTMLVMMGIVVPLIDSRDVTLKGLTIGLIFWPIAGLIYSYIYLRPKEKKTKEL
jgi:hypothetical protein